MKAVSGSYERCKSYVVQLNSYKERCINDKELSDLYAWFTNEVIRVDLDKSFLKDIMGNDFMNLNFEEKYSGMYPPEFRRGDKVEVIVNARNLTYHNGIILESLWHFKDKEWKYILEESGKRVSKRYSYNDLKSQ